MESKLIDRTSLISISDYADKEKVTRQTVYNWIKEKKIKSVEIAGKIFIQQ